MAMKETAGTLQAYFGISGGLAALSSITQVVSANLGTKLVGVINLAFGIAFVVIAVRLRTLLAHSPHHVIWVLLASGGWTVLLFFVSLLAGFQPATIAISVLSIAIVWYLYVNTRRLSVEATAAAQAEHGFPTAS